MFVMVGYVRKMTVKKSCKYGEYRPFEHLLFLLQNVVCHWFVEATVSGCMKPVYVDLL